MKPFCFRLCEENRGKPFCFRLCEENRVKPFCFRLCEENRGNHIFLDYVKRIG